MSGKKVVSKPWTEIERKPLNLQGKPISTEKISDIRKNYQLIPENARQFYDEILKSRSENFVDDVDGFSAENFDHDGSF